MSDTALATQFEAAHRTAEALYVKHRRTAAEFGTVLADIHNRGLYKAEFTTFDDYVGSAFDLSRRYAYDLIERAKAVLPSPPDEEPDVVPGGDDGDVIDADYTVTLAPAPKPEARPEPRKIVIDGAGKEITKPHCLDAWASRGKVRKARDEVHDLLKKLGALADDPATSPFLEWQRLESSLRDATTVINFASMWATCPYCQGRKCKNCRNSGWMPREMYKRVPGSVKGEK